MRSILLSLSRPNSNGDNRMRKEIEEESTSILQLAGVPASRLRSLYAAFGQSKTKLDTLESHFKSDFQKASHFYLWSQGEPFHHPIASTRL